MRILFELPYPGYLRIYGTTVRELTERGHTVLLAYDSTKRHDPAAAEIEALPGVEVVDAPPARFRPIVDRVRLAADYLRYLDPAFANAPHLRRRMKKFLPGRLSLALRIEHGNVGTRAALRAAVSVDRVVPARSEVRASLRSLRPDVVVTALLVGRGAVGARQTETAKAALAERVPVVGCVSSWDHLSTKGIFKVVPDRVFVWNEIQRREAAELHRIPPARVVVTGAQLFDVWFARAPSTTRGDFAAEHGLDAAQPYVLYVGSSPNIAPGESEVGFVRRWLAALRDDPALRDVGVLVRPHPGNVEVWADVDLSAERAVVVPRERPGIPMAEHDEALYFDSIHHSAAVVGLNTSAIIESLIQKRVVLTLHAPEFAETQDGTLHFHYLLPESGGAVREAHSIEEHLAQLRGTLEDPGSGADIERFVRSFVRPRGLDVRASSVVADEIEAAARR